MDWLGWFRKPNGGRHGKDAGAPAGSSPPSAPTAPQRAPLPSASPATPEEIRRLLFDAVAAGDDRQLESLCQEHRDLILTHAAGWLEIPAAFRASPEVYEWYGNGLRAIAQFCQDRLGQRPAVPSAHHSPTPPVPHG